MINVDFETFSELNLPQVGAYRYAQHPSTEALMLGWAIDDGPISVWDIANGEPCPMELHRALFQTNDLISAFNAQFERLIFKHCLKWDIPASRFYCSQVRAFTLAFKGGLDQVCEQFNIGQGKYVEGKILMKKFSMLQGDGTRIRPADAPEEYERYKAYCAKDVEVERALGNKLNSYTTVTKALHEEYVLDQAINDNGLPIDIPLVSSSLELAEIEKEILFNKLQKLTGLENPNSNTQFRQWLDANGYELPNMQKETISKLLDTLAPGLVRDAVVYKQQISKTSTAKWEAIARSLCTDERIHGAFQFIGASRTGRYAGRILQPQNLPRGTIENPDLACDLIKQGHEFLSALYPSVMDVLSSTIRGAITAPPGNQLVISDLSSIESRIIGWLTQCQRINRLFEQGKDTYKDLATQIFCVPYEEVTKHQRFVAKPASLGGQYMLGGKGLKRYAENFGVNLSDDEAQEHINAYRSMYPEIPTFWYWLKDTVDYVITTGVGMSGYGLRIVLRGEFLFIKLPGGRNLAYYQPAMQDRPAPWDKNQMIRAFTYMGMNSYTNRWDRISAHAGGVTENIVQAIARDILMEWMKRIAFTGYKIIGHVHDEVILECDENAEGVLEHINQMIRAPIDWAPGLLLDAGGFVSERYKKD